MSLAQEMLARLRSPDCPQRAVVRVLPGEGVRDALATFAVEVSTKGLVLVMAPSLLLVYQWADRMREKGGVSVHILSSAADALELRSRAVAQVRRGVVLCTLARARHGQAQVALGERQFELVIYDGLTGGLPESVAAGEHLAARSLAVVPGTSPFVWEGSVPLFDVTEDDFDRAVRDVTMTVLQFDDEPRESASLREAQALLARYLPEFVSERVASPTPAFVHEQLLKLATGVVAADEASDAERAAAWRLVDEVESIPVNDPRLLALDHALGLSADRNRWVVVVVARADAAYVAEHLSSQGRNVRELTGASPFEERHAVLSGDAEIIVATAPILGTLQQWPRGYGAVWWTPPRSRAEYEQRMILLATGGRVPVIQLGERRSDWVLPEH